METQSTGLRLAQRPERRNPQLPRSRQAGTHRGLPLRPAASPGRETSAGFTPARAWASVSVHTGSAGAGHGPDQPGLPPPRSRRSASLTSGRKQKGLCRTAPADTSAGERRDRGQAARAARLPRLRRAALHPHTPFFSEVGRRSGCQGQAKKPLLDSTPCPATPGGPGSPESERGIAGLLRGGSPQGAGCSQQPQPLGGASSAASAQLPGLVPTLLPTGLSGCLFICCSPQEGEGEAGESLAGRKEGGREEACLTASRQAAPQSSQPPKAPPAPSPSLRPRSRGRHPGSAAAPRRPRPNGTGSSVQQSLLTGGRPLGLLGPDGAATPPPPPSACLPGTPAVPRPPALGASCLHRTSTADTFPEPG